MDPHHDSRDGGDRCAASASMRPHGDEAVRQPRAARRGRVMQSVQRARVPCLKLAWFIVGMTVALLPVRGRADGLRAEVEGGAAIVRGATTAAGLEVVGESAVGGYADLQAGVLLIGSSRFGNTSNPNQLAAFAQVAAHVESFYLGVGLAKLQRGDAYDSGPLNFALSAQYRIGDHLSLVYRHFSNAGSRYPNFGRDLALVGWRF